MLKSAHPAVLTLHILVWNTVPNTIAATPLSEGRQSLPETPPMPAAATWSTAETRLSTVVGRVGSISTTMWPLSHPQLCRQLLRCCLYGSLSSKFSTSSAMPLNSTMSSTSGSVSSTFATFFGCCQFLAICHYFFSLRHRLSIFGCAHTHWSNPCANGRQLRLSRLLERYTAEQQHPQAHWICLLQRYRYDC